MLSVGLHENRKKSDEKPKTPKITAKYFNKKLFLVWYLSQSNRYTNDDSYHWYINSVFRCNCICWRMSLAFSIIRCTAGSKNGLLHFFKVCVTIFVRWKFERRVRTQYLRSFQKLCRFNVNFIQWMHSSHTHSHRHTQFLFKNQF